MVSLELIGHATPARLKTSPTTRKVGAVFNRTDMSIYF